MSGPGLWTLVLGAALAASAAAPADGDRPLSYVLADTAFLADELSAAQDEGLDWATRVSEYLSLVERTVGAAQVAAENGTGGQQQQQAPRRRRDLPTDPLATLTQDPQGVYLLEKLEERYIVPAKFPNDVVVFSRAESGGVVWYAAALEADAAYPQLTLANALVLYKLMGNSFLEQTRVSTFAAATLAVQEIGGWVYLVAAERAAQHRDAPQGGSILYRLSHNGRSLIPVETLETTNPSDVCFWSFNGATYLAVASEHSNASYAADTLVYRWFGEHLDIIQRLPTHGARAVSAFSIDTNQYLAVANHVDDQGDTNIDSVVYRFDMVRERFVVHQQLRTHAAVDVDFFTMNRSRGADNFLVVANNYYKGPGQLKNPTTNSVMYKWTEGFFVPFQSFWFTGASQWTPFSGPNGEAALLAVSAAGLHAFQYDGWRFQEMVVSALPLLRGPQANIAHVRTASINGEGLLVVASKANAGTQYNVFAVVFSPAAPLKQLYAEMNYWCQGELARTATDSVDELARRVAAAPKWDSPVVELDTVSFESAKGSTIKTLVANKIKPTGPASDPEYVERVNGMVRAHAAANLDLAAARDSMNKALKKDRPNDVGVRVVIDNARVSCPLGGCRFGHAHVGRLGGEDAADLVNNAVRLDEDIALAALRFTNLVVPGNLVASRVLGESAPLLSRVETQDVLGSLVVNEVRVDAGLNVDGPVDGVLLTRDAVLLTEGDQRLPDFTSTSETWEVRKLVLNGRVNGMTVDVSRPVLPPEVPPTATIEPLNLEVRDVRILGKLLGSVDIEDVDRRALRRSGRQFVTAIHKFEHLKVDEAEALELPFPIADVIRADAPATVPGQLVFSQAVTASSVQVLENLNHVAAAKDGSLDLLLRDGQVGGQTVTGSKWVRSLEMTDVATIRGRILGLEVPARGDVRVIQDEVVVEGDVTISGQVTVLGDVVATDITEAGSGLSVSAVLRDGVRLGQPLPPSVVFEHLEVANLAADVVNGVPTSQWVVDSPDAVVHMQQPVTFAGDVVVAAKSTLLGKVNAVDLRVLDETALKTTGEQVVLGHKTFDSVDTHTVWSNDTWLGGARWLDLWGGARPQAPADNILRLEDDVVIQGSLNVKRLKVDGTLGDVNLNATLKDSVFSDSVVVIDGPMTFTQTITVDDLHVDPSAEGTDLSGLVAASRPAPEELEFDFRKKPLYIKKSLSVSRLGFNGYLDGMSDADWSAPWLEVDGDQTLYGPQVVAGNVDALSGVHVANGVNGIDLKWFADRMARIDDPDLRLGSVIFEAPVVAHGAVSAGSVGGVRLSDALLARGMPEQEVRGRLTLAAGLEATGSLVVVGALNGENLTNLCDFADPSPAHLNVPQHLTVTGDAFMDEEPVLQDSVNGQSLAKLLNNTWMKDRSATITAAMEFGDLVFHSNVVVKDRIDGVSLDAISQRYFSRSQDGVVSTNLNIAGGVVVQGQLVSGGPVDVAGTVGGERLSELPNRVLMDGPDQDISARMTFGVVLAEGDVSLQGTVNGLDLAKDVVLLKPNAIEALNHNVVTGAKKIRGRLRVTDLGVQEGGRVQDVDLVAWNREAVRVQGDYTVTGSKTLSQPEVVGGLNVGGLVNGVAVDADHLLVRNLDQTITGAKTLQPAPLVGLGLRVGDLSVTGSVNDVKMLELLVNQAYRTGDVTVAGPVSLASVLHADRVWLDGLYQNVNVSYLIYAAQHPPGLDQYAELHDRLQAVAGHVQRSLKSQGYYLNHYHTAVELRTGVRAVLPLGKGADGAADVQDAAYAIAVVREASPRHDLALSFYSWDSESGTIVQHPHVTPVSLPRTVRMLEPAEWSGQNAIYWESSEDSGVHFGHVMGLLRSGRLGVAQVLRDALPSAWVVVRPLGATNCLVRGAPGSVEGVDGFCALHCLSAGRETRQALPVPRAMHAAVLSVRGVPHVFVASGASERSEGSVTAWRWEADAASLRLVQAWGVANASSLAAVEYRGIQYLAAASGHVEGTPHRGLVHISRYDVVLGEFSHWQSLEVEGPRAMQFAQLPSGELVLYVATWCPTDSLVVFQYRGVSGFVRRASAAVPSTGVLSAFTTVEHQHVVAVSGSAGLGGGQAALLRASFKGSWEASEVAYRQAQQALRRG